MIDDDPERLSRGELSPGSARDRGEARVTG
jgi:hypothetical protein